jgi:ornithine decarboxylase
VSPARINAQQAAWTTALPTVQPFYAVKCNPEPILLNHMANAGWGFDCASARELSLVPQGTPILYANPCKRDADILFAQNKGITTTVIDSKEEVEKLLEVGWKGDALVRLKVEDAGSTMPFSAKFGLAPKELSRLARFSKQRGLKIAGLSFHVGSGCLTPKQFYDAILESILGIRLMRKMGALAKDNPAILDIGGGFVSGPGFTDAAKWIRAAQATSQGEPLRFVAEPGRFFAATSQDLFTQVIGKKKGPANGWRYTIDESLYGQFSCIPFDHAKPRWLRVRTDPGEKARKRSAAVLYGRTCDSLDMIACAREAEELEVGDWLWWPHMGAYTTVTATEFNGFPQPAKVVDCALPCPTSFDTDVWPRGVEYPTTVKVPRLA